MSVASMEQSSFSGRAFLGYLNELRAMIGVQTVKMILRNAGWLGEVRSIISLSHFRVTPTQVLIDVNREIESIFGETAKKTIIFSSARKSFVYSYGGLESIQQTYIWLQENPESPLRLRAAIEAVIDAIEETTDQKIKLQESSSHYHLTFDHSIVSSGKKDQAYPGCFYTLGIIRGGLTHLFQTDLYPVQELSCVSAGDPSCEFIVRKFPFSEHEKGSGKTSFLSLPGQLRG